MLFMLVKYSDHILNFDLLIIGHGVVISCLTKVCSCTTIRICYSMLWIDTKARVLYDSSTKPCSRKQQWATVHSIYA